MSTWHKLESSERRESHLRKHLHKIKLNASLEGTVSIVIGRGGPSPLWVVPTLGWLGSIRKMAEHVMRSKPVSSTLPWPPHQLLPPGSCPVWVPVLTSFDDEQQYGSISQRNPFLSNLVFSYVFIATMETLTLTWIILMASGKVVLNGNKYSDLSNS